MKRSPCGVDDISACAAKRLGDEEGMLAREDCRVELHELEVGDARARARGFEDALAVAQPAVGGALVQARITASRQNCGARANGQAS